MFHHTGQTIVLFDYQFERRTHTFSFTRVDMDGKVEQEGSLIVEVETLPCTKDQCLDSFTTTTTLVAGCTFIWAYSESGWRSNTSATALKCSNVVYDSTHDKLVLRQKSVPADSNTTPQINTHFFWNNVAYYRVPCYKNSTGSGSKNKRPMDFDKFPILNIVDFEEEVIREAQVSRMTEPRDDDKNRILEWFSSRFLGDGRFLISFSWHEYRIFGFEKHTPVAGEDMTSKKARESAES